LLFDFSQSLFVGPKTPKQLKEATEKKKQKEKATTTMKQLLAASAGKARARKPATIPCPSCGQAAAGHNQTACVAAQRAKVH
jgi:hypothetical protein